MTIALAHAERLVDAGCYACLQDAFATFNTNINHSARAARRAFATAMLLALYDEALAIRPQQRDALLGRAIALTFLGRSDDAIAAATRLLELGTWYQGDAHYWRAWNRYQQRNLPAAAAEIADARKLLQNIDVFTLSGMIAYDQMRRADARRDFMEVRRVAPESCTASWFLGLIEGDEGALAMSVGEFTAAAGCYERTADAFRREAAALPEDLEPAQRTRQMADFDRWIAESVIQAARSSFNAAQASVRLGDRQEALAHAKRASTHPELKTRADIVWRRFSWCAWASRI